MRSAITVGIVFESLKTSIFRRNGLIKDIYVTLLLTIVGKPKNYRVSKSIFEYKESPNFKKLSSATKSCSCQIHSAKIDVKHPVRITILRTERVYKKMLGFMMGTGCRQLAIIAICCGSHAFLGGRC